MKNKVEIFLHHPIKIDGVETKKLEMRRPVVRDRILAARNTGDKTDDEIDILMFASLLDISEESLHDMDLLDYEQCMDAFHGFLKKPGSQSGT